MAYELKTKVNDSDVEAFLNAVPDERKRADSFTLLEMMKDVTGEEPKMWGSAIVGFGHCHYKYETGHEGDMPLTGFSPRKQNLSLYILAGYDEEEELLARLGKHKAGKSCLYLNKLDDADQATLREMIRLSVEHTKKLYP